jgi:putative nucleotidyltransferase with HDIG domain
MSLDVSQAEQAALEETLARRESGMGPDERRSALLGAVVFLAGQVALLLCAPLHGGSVVEILVSVCVLALCTRVRIDTPLGFTAPTQLALIPLLFAAPVAAVPVLAMLALGAGAMVDVVRGRMRPFRLLYTPGNGVAALGPAAVFVLAGVAPRHAGPLLLLAALATQIAVDFAASTLRDLVSRGISLNEQLSESWVYAVDAALSPIALVVARAVHDTPLSVLALLPLLGLLHVFAAERRKRLESTLELSSAYRGTALVLGDVIEADDGYTGQHCKSVVALALAVGEELGVEPERQRNLEFGALLHDVGKVAIPKEIINKPGKLDPHEWTIIKTHTIEGQRMLDQVGGFMREVGAVVRAHHERWDGGGYPDGAAGERIPIEARIVTACDAWNAMRTDRAYRQALSYEAAVAEMIASSGTQFDPRIVEALLRVVARDEPADATGGPTAPAVEPPASEEAQTAAAALNRPGW